jgi:hypothetical protein
MVAPDFDTWDARSGTDADKVAAIVAARAKGTGVRRIGREFGVGVGTVLRLTGEAALVRRLTGTCRLP